ncbi:umecyanin-like [Macadamia integrifolia]|uniref:umecyanin-like n=1 Tax=Macadamia integrifolia TaxID=60698 RepID=UPI001C4F6FF2|nr:umecyanin-like [Macadamia integrifolia]
MASHMGCFLGCVLIVVALLQGAAAKTHIVGDTSGWTVPSSSSFYVNWAASQTFSVDDILEFNFQTGSHDVAVVSKADYTSCTKGNPIGSIINTGPAKITINSTGDHYYICTFGQHCENNQKLAITVGSTNGTTPTPTPTPTSSPGPSSSTTPTTPTGTSPTSSPSSASSLTVGGFSFLLLSTVIAFFY